jgi:8-oxo-dGTP pyrophosphatase MutT (NUDIX family)
MNIQEYKRLWKGDMRKVTLSFLIEGDKVLLAMKKRGFGVGKWNGVGGKLKEGESLEQAAAREAQEEVGIVPKEMKYVGVIRFYFDGEDKATNNQECHVYTVSSWEKEPVESEEMKPQWFEKDKLPLESMWSDDKYWLPKVLNGKFIEAEFLFDENNKVMDLAVNER